MQDSWDRNNRIKFHDGVVRTITDGRHVLELKISSLWVPWQLMVVKLCLKVKISRSFRGSLLVMKGHKLEILYSLLGNTITNGT